MTVTRVALAVINVVNGQLDKMPPWRWYPEPPCPNYHIGLHCEQDQPNSWHWGPLEWTYGPPGCCTYSQVAGQRGDNVVISRAAGLPLSQLVVIIMHVCWYCIAMVSGETVLVTFFLNNSPVSNCKHSWLWRCT